MRNSIRKTLTATTGRRRVPCKKETPLSPTALTSAISLLPSRFTPSDLTSLISSTPDPRLIPDLLSWALHHHPLRLRSSPDPFLAAIRRLSSARLTSQLSSLTSLALSLPHLPLSTHPHLNSILRSLSHSKLLSKAIYLYKRMRSSPDPAGRPDLTSFRILFSALLSSTNNPSSYISHLNMTNVRLLFRQMIDSGVEPDLFVLNVVIRGYSLSLHMNDALRIFHQMVPVYGVDPDVDTYDCLVMGLCKQGRTRNARELFDEMWGKGMVPSLRVCNALVCAMAMAGEVREAAEVMWAVARKGRGVDRISCRTLIEETCRKGGVEDGMRLLREMEEKELVDGWMYRELLHCIQDEFGEVNDCRDNHYRT